MSLYVNQAGVPLPVAFGREVVLVAPGEWVDLPEHEGDKHRGLSREPPPRRLVLRLRPPPPEPPPEVPLGPSEMARIFPVEAGSMEAFREATAVGIVEDVASGGESGVQPKRSRSRRKSVGAVAA